jgi:hypothetical protein
VERLSDTVRGQLGRFGAQSALGELLDRWPEAVGEGIARNAWPARVSRDGTLVVHTADSVWAFELGSRAAEIAERLGVEKVRFVPGPLPGREDEPETFTPGPEPSPAQSREAAEIAAGIEDEKLRESIERAVSLGLARDRVDRPL